VRTEPRTVGSVGQRGQATLLVAGEPVVARHPHPLSHLNHSPAVLHNRQDCLVPPFHDAELHQDGPPLPRRQAETRRWDVSSISRSHKDNRKARRLGGDMPLSIDDAGMELPYQAALQEWLVIPPHTAVEKVADHRGSRLVEFPPPSV
jgi:hypothetical protein